MYLNKFRSSYRIQVLLFVLHNILEELDLGGYFDLYSLNVLVAKKVSRTLLYYEIGTSSLYETWYMLQFRIREWWYNPIGTKLSPIFFTVLVNQLVQDWYLRVKFVDDLN